MIDQMVTTADVVQRSAEVAQFNQVGYRLRVTTNHSLHPVLSNTESSAGGARSIQSI